MQLRRESHAARAVFALAAMALVPQAALGASVNIGNAAGQAGTAVTISVALTAGPAEQVAGTQNDIAFDPTKMSIPAGSDGKPQCQVNPAIGKKIVKSDNSEEPGFAFRLGGGSCDPATSQCDGIRAIVLSTEVSNQAVDPLAPIESGSVLYTCTVNIAGGATPGTIDLTNSNVIASDPTGDRLQGVTAGHGTVTVQPGTRCVGDCNGDTEVFGNEITKAINIVAGTAELSTCEAADANGDDEVFGNEVTIGINNLANGCPQ